jgi:hypothetical protein
MSESVVPESGGRGFAALSNPYVQITQKRSYNLFLVGKKAIKQPMT